jgi:broad specificity phosphatase PhoE
MDAIIDIFRHAESTANAGLPSDTPASTPLTEKGQRQAKRLSVQFGELAPCLIITSPYQRTDETAAPTMARFPKALHEVWPIHEFTYMEVSKYKGTTYLDRKPMTERYWQAADPDYVDGPGAESFNHMVGRMDAALGRLASLHHPYVAMFGHGLTMQVKWLRLTRPDLQGRALMQYLAETRAQNRAPNTGRLRLGLTKGRLQVLTKW